MIKERFDLATYKRDCKECEGRGYIIIDTIEGDKHLECPICSGGTWIKIKDKWVKIKGKWVAK